MDQGVLGDLVELYLPDLHAKIADLGAKYFYYKTMLEKGKETFLNSG